MNTKWDLISRWSLSLVFGAFLVSCGGGDEGTGTQAAAKPATVSSTYGIRAHVTVAGHPEQSGWVSVPPVDFGAWANGGQLPNRAVKTRALAAPAAPRPSTLSLTPPPRHVEATVGNGMDGGIASEDTNADDAKNNYAPGWSLLYWATTACYSQTDPSQAPANAAPGLFVSTTPWIQRFLGNPENPSLVRDYYIFGASTGDAAGGQYYKNPDDMSCDALLAMQETLLCAADHLAQLGDSPGTVTWAGAPGGITTDAQGQQTPGSTITVTIPPQRTEDIFIARDMALNALAHLLRLDTKRKTFSNAGDDFQYDATCVSEYSYMAANGNLDNNVLELGNSYFDPVPLTATPSSDDLKAAAVRRLTRKSSALVGAARLTKDLVERSVQDDISGAQQRLSASTDPHAGARSAWGVEDGQSPYNTLRHALRTLFGRLEIGNGGNPDQNSLQPNGGFVLNGQVDWTPHDVTRDDPKCGFSYDSVNNLIGEQVGAGASALDELLQIPGVSARWDDIPPKTTGESLALTLINTSGIIVPPTLVDAAGGASVVRSAVQSILEDDAAQRANQPLAAGATPRFATTADFLASTGGQAFDATLASISDAEMLFGLERAYDAFRLLTGSEETTVDEFGARSTVTKEALQIEAELAVLPLRTSAAISGLNGIVLDGGIPRDLLAIDPMAGLYQVQNASACSIDASSGTVGSYATFSNVEDALTARGADVAGFQNPFFLGEGFRRVLASIAYEAVNQSATNAAVAPIAQFAKLSAAEVREWAGPGTILTKQAAGDPTVQEVYLVNIAPEDLGVPAPAGAMDPATARQAQLAELQRRLVLVSMPSGNSPLAANCVAGLRPCPSATSMEVREAKSCDDFGVVQAPLSALLDNVTIKLTFDASAGFSNSPGSHLVLRSTTDCTTATSAQTATGSAEGTLPTCANGDVVLYCGSTGQLVCNSQAVLDHQTDGQPGQVLAWLKGGSQQIETFYSPADADPIFAETYSRLQRSLAGKVFGLDQSAQATRSCTNIAPLSLPADYCIAGMKRDAFVPLANELNSSGGAVDNSWQNYLDLADAAATKVDTLGAAMIADGLSSDVQKESAVEKVADLCGGFSGVDGVASSGGSVTIPAGDQQLSSCINPTVYDIVYFRSDPFGPDGSDAGKNTQTYNAIWDAYCATTSTSGSHALVSPQANSKPPFCAGRKRGDKITHAGLGFSSSTVQPPGGDINKACAALVGGLDTNGSAVAGALTMRALATDPPPVLNSQQYNAAVSMSSSRAGGIGSALQQLHLSETPDGEWLLTLADRILTGSTNAIIKATKTAGNATPAGDIWPYCATKAGPCSVTGAWIGNVFANPGGTGGSAALRSIVERTIFYMGALSGSVPQGHVQMPLPVVDRTDPLQVLGPLPSIALYAPGKFVDNQLRDKSFSITNAKSANGDYQGEDSWGGPQEIAALGLAYAAPDGYATDRAGGPTWRNAAYSAPAPLKYVTASNDTIAFDPGLIGGQTEDQSGRKLLDIWLQQMGQEYVTGNPMFLENVEEAAFYTTGKMCAAGNFHHGRSVCSGAPGAPTFFYDWPAAMPEQVNCANLESPDLSDGLATTNLLYNNFEGGPGFAWISPATVAGTTVPFNSQADYPEADSGGYYFVGDYHAGRVPGTPLPHQMVATETEQSFNWDDVHWVWGDNEVHSIWQDRLKASVCPPSQRLEMYLDTDLQDRATAMETLIRALSVSCFSANSAVSVELRNTPPPIQTVDDIRYLSSWVNQLGYSVDSIAAYMYLVNVPAEVVDLAKAGGSPDLKAIGAAARGQSLLDLQQNMHLIESGFATVGANLQAISAAIEKTRVELSLTNDQGQARGLQIQAAQLNNERDKQLARISLVAGILKLVSSSTLGVIDAAKGGPGAAANNIIDAGSQIASAATNLEFDSKIGDNITAQAAVGDKTTADQQSLDVLSLSDSIAALNVNIDTTMTGIKNNTLAALKDIGLLVQNQSDAKIALAAASGADWVNINGKNAPLHVNTVYRRQFDIAQMRYTQALEGAKRAAYLARLAIEQRLGVRLDDLHQNIGPLEPPATWVDDLCTVQGVNYSKLSTALPPSTGSTDPTLEKQLEKGFANQFIGDYVSKLREFVQFYNVAFPFQESDDVAIVSLREDLPSSLTSCLGASRNLLLYSDRLDISSPDVTSATQSTANPTDVLVARGGWRTTGCDNVACLSVQGGATILADSPLPVEGPGAASLLSTTARTAQGVFQGSAPPAAVFQTVQLTAGTSYVLSWWDIARNTDGTSLSGSRTPPSYQAAIFDSSWNLVGGSTYQPGKSWGDRHTLQIFTKADGGYNVVFTSAPPGTVSSTGLGIANVQIEQAQSDQDAASPYESNAGSATHVTGKCATDSPSQLRDRFQRKCDQLGCFYELRDVLAIDTQLLNQGSSSLLGKLATGNYNYRNGTLAVNFVGTGVIDCSRSASASCNGSAYVDYDLEHVAYDVPMDDHSGSVRCFDFGAGKISDGKGLASERFITLPMSSADRDIINQSPFLKPDFSGRPLSGSYRLRVKDSPSLVWSNVQDVQLIYGYHYWSRVQQSPGN